MLTGSITLKTAVQGVKGVEAIRLTNGASEYIRLHAVSSEDASELACGDLVVAGSRDSG